MSKRKNHAPAFKVRVALAALSGEKTVTELSAEFGAHQALIHKWVKQLKESAAGIFPVKSKPKRPERKSSFKFFTPKSANLPWNVIF